MDRVEILDLILDKCTWNNYQKFLAMEHVLQDNNKYYLYFDDIKLLLNNENSFVRVRAFKIICVMYKYDKDNKIEKIISELLNVLDDKKPTNIRVCLSYVSRLIENKPLLKEVIKNKLLGINTTKYRDTIAPLIRKDLDNIFKKYY